MKVIAIFGLILVQVVFGTVDRTWWKYTTMYEVYLPSFMDSNGDGIGDLKGLTLKLDHFVELGIETIYISPHYESPQEDAGYDVSNFTSINPMFGTMDDFDELVKEMNKRGLKLVIDVIINHSSAEHPWFKMSVERIPPYTDFYVWKDGKGNDSNGNPIPPTNWVSIFKGSAWSWNEKRGQFYLRQFSSQQPDLNLRNRLVKIEMKKIFKFWLDKGVGGFRLDATKYLIEDEQFRDEPVVNPKVVVPYEYRDVNHIHTANLWQTYELLHEFREFVDKVTKKFDDFERILIPEAYLEGRLLYQYYGRPGYKIAHFPLNFAFVLVDKFQNASFYHNLTNKYLNGLPEGATPCWNSENHDKYRKAMMFNPEYEYIYTTMVMLLPGVAYVYYGQEIGMIGSRMREDRRIDKYVDDFTGTTRDAYRTPMQWDDSLNAGFTNSLKTYLPVSSDYWRINVKKQKQERNSHYSIFKKTLDLRRTDTFKYGDFKSYIISEWVFAFSRSLKGQETYVVVYNLGSEIEIISLSNSIPNLPEYMTVELGSPNSGYEIGDCIRTISAHPKELSLRPFATIVLTSKQQQ